MVRPERWNLNSKAFLLIFYLWKHRWLVEYGEWWLHVVLSSCLSEDWENELSPAWCRWNLNTSHHQRHHLQVHLQSPRHRPEWYKIKESAKKQFLKFHLSNWLFYTIQHKHYYKFYLLRILNHVLELWTNSTTFQIKLS